MVGRKQNIAEDVLRLPTERVNHGVQTEIGLAMRRLGFLKTRGMISGHNTWYYKPSQALRDMEVGSQKHYLRLVANAEIKK